MAIIANYPQLPKNVWNGVWSILRKTPRRKLDEKALSAELAVQPTAAKAYSRELVKIGLLDEDCNPTELANKWRQDPNDTNLRLDILRGSYPAELIELAPIDDIDREKITRWFLNEGLGEGAARNKAATYVILSEGVNPDTASIPQKVTPRANRTGTTTPKPPNDRVSEKAEKSESPKSRGAGIFTPELAVNVQIHINADASGEQIDAIFSSMKKYFSQ